jgi:Ca-activated chloride channel family protein
MNHVECRAGRKAAQRSRPLLFLLTLFAAVSSASAQPPPAATPAAGELVTISVTVTGEGGRYVTGLGTRAFTVTEGKARREITLFEAGEVPARVFVLFDVSGSINDKRLNEERFALVRLIQLSSLANEYFIGEFNSRYRAVTGWTRDAKALADGLNRIAGADLPGRQPQPRGATALYDACDAALEELTGASFRKRVLLLFTDGNPDNFSRHAGFKSLSRKFKETGVLFYPVVVKDRIEPLLVDYGLRELNDLAKDSGGNILIVKTTEGLNEAVERVAVELRSQYLIGFAPSNAAGAGKWNQVKITLTKPEGVKGSINVRSREGYFTRPAGAGDP